MSLDEGGAAAARRGPASRRGSAGRGLFAGLEREGVTTAALVAIAVVLVVAALDLAAGIAIPTVLAALTAIALAPATRRLERTGLPAALAAAVIVAGTLAGAAAGVYALAPSADEWNARAPQMLRDIESKARRINRDVARSVGMEPEATFEGAEATLDDDAGTAGGRGEAGAGGEGGNEAAAEKEDEDAVGKLVDGGQRLAADLAISAPAVVGGAVYWAFLTFFMLKDRGGLARLMMSLAPRPATRRALGRAMRDVQAHVSRYLFAITVINVALGVCVAVAFHLVGMPSPALWGVAAGLLNFMPFVGAALMVVLSGAVGLVSYDDPAHALLPVAVILALNMVEGQVVTPLAIGARLRLSPLGVFVAIAFGAWLWGAAGALIATPTLIVASAFFVRLDRGAVALRARPEGR